MPLALLTPPGPAHLPGDNTVACAQRMPLVPALSRAGARAPRRAWRCHWEALRPRQASAALRPRARLQAQQLHRSQGWARATPHYTNTHTTQHR
jgi:hypothetical protein